jgi:hypothetical protein
MTAAVSVVTATAAFIQAGATGLPRHPATQPMMSLHAYIKTGIE